MGETLGTFLKRQARDSLDYLLRELEEVTEAEAQQDAHANWPPQKWGVGQDGSMAGIVYHVAVWKQLTLPLFAPDGTAQTLGDFDPSSAPERTDWSGLKAWLHEVSSRWQATLDALPESAFSETRNWEGATITVAQFVFEMLKHDIQHAAQLEYLKQLHKSQTGNV